MCTEENPKVIFSKNRCGKVRLRLWLTAVKRQVDTEPVANSLRLFSASEAGVPRTLSTIASASRYGLRLSYRYDL
jgi:hypothetical protein